MMHKKVFRYSLLLSLLLLFVCALSACGSAATDSPAPTPTPKPKTPKELLASASDTMKTLKSAHVVTDLTSAASANGQNATVGIKYQGDTISPDQASLDFSMTIASGTQEQTVKLKEVVKGDKVYIRNPAEKWFVLDKSVAQSDLGLQNQDNTKLYTVAQKGTLTDHGSETVSGKKLRHITSQLDKTQAQDLLSTLGSSSSTNKVNDAVIDFWIEEATSYTYHINMKLNLVSTSSGKEVPTKVTSDTLYSKFNDVSITVTPPANAIPAKNVQDVLK